MKIKNILVDTNILIYWDKQCLEFYKYTMGLINLQKQNKIKLFISNYTYVDFYKWVNSPEFFKERTPKYFDNNIKMIDFNIDFENYLWLLVEKYWNINLDNVIFNSNDWNQEIYNWIKFKEIIRLSSILSTPSEWINIKWTDHSIVLDLIFGSLVYDFDYFISGDKKLIKALNRLKNSNLELLFFNERANIFWKTIRALLKKVFTEIIFVNLDKTKKNP